MKKIDLVGKRFGRLLVVREVKERKNTRIHWESICDCGNKIICSGKNLISNNTKSCGCLSIDRASEVHTTHGMIKTRFYKIWKSMNTRCKNSNDPNYIRYGNRGIKILWQSFEEFRDSMFKSYQSHIQEFGEKNTSIDRIDNSGNYSKENCRWATKIEQANNKSNNIFYKFKNKKYSLIKWSKITEINYHTLYGRIKRNWSIDRIFTKV